MQLVQLVLALAQPQPWVLLGGLLLLLLAIAPAVLAWRRRERHSATNARDRDAQ